MEYTFMRKEKKYLVTREQVSFLQKQLTQQMVIDRCEEYLVQNIYFDTPGWDIIRESIEKPFYKEKLRLRFYDQYNPESKGFLELKKKYDGIVYKRRMAFTLGRLQSGSIREIVSADDSQISNEIGFFLQNNAVSEKIHVSYRRTAYNKTGNGDFRVTFDRDISFQIINQRHNFSSDYGRQILSPNQMIMEIKTSGAIPLWFSHTLSELKIFPVSFSKVGTCYRLHMNKYQNCLEEKNAA